MWQLIFWDSRDPLKIVMTTTTEVSGSETKENSNGAAVATLVL